MLRLQYFGHLMRRADSLEKTLIMGKMEGKRRRRWQRIRWLGNITDSVDMHLSKLQEIVEDRGAWHAAVHGVTKSWTQLSNNNNNNRSYYWYPHFTKEETQNRSCHLPVVTWGMRDGPQAQGPQSPLLSSLPCSQEPSVYADFLKMYSQTQKQFWGSELVFKALHAYGNISVQIRSCQSTVLPAGIVCKCTFS